VQDFRELKVWEKAHILTLEIYRATRSFPSDESYGLTSQMRRAAASIGANIAEGCGRESRPDFARFLQNAAGSASEVEYHLLLAGDLGYLSLEICGRLKESVSEVKRMLTGLIQRLKRSPVRTDGSELSTDD
jgi:four helix bundle protein